MQLNISTAVSLTALCLTSLLTSLCSAQNQLVSEGDEWLFFRGTQEPPIDWKDLEFDAEDAGWEFGPTGIGYGDDDDATILDDMQGNYVSVFLRVEFVVPENLDGSAALLRVRYDDSFVAYIDGAEIARRGLVGDPPLFDETPAVDHEITTTAGGFDEEFVIDVDGLTLSPGTHVLAAQVHNVNLTSSDLSFSAELEASPFVVTEVVPAFGPPEGGNEVHIAGIGFNVKETPVVRFDGVESPSVAVASSFLTVEVPPAKLPGAVDVSIEDSRGTFVLRDGYRYTGFGQTALAFDGDNAATCSGLDGFLEEGTIQLWFANGAAGFFGGFTWRTLLSLESVFTGEFFRIEVRTGDIRARLMVDGAFQDVGGAADIGENVWHHVAYTFSSKGRQLYLDGNLVGQDAALAEMSEVDRMRIGASFDGGNGLLGNIESVGLTRDALEADEIRQRVFVPTHEQPGALASWPLDEGSGDVARDAVADRFEMVLGDGGTPPAWVNTNGFPTLAVTGVSPARGSTEGGDTVTIVGGGFALGDRTTVSFGGVQSEELNVVSSWELTAVTPPAAVPGRVDVVVQTPRGTAIVASGFTYDPPNLRNLVREGDVWDYLVPTAPVPEDWNVPEFRPQDEGWSSGPTGLGYGDGDDATILDNVQDLALAVYARRDFTFNGNADTIEFLSFRIRYDDSFVAYLNGVEIARANLLGDPPAFDEAASDLHEITTGPGAFDEDIDVGDFRSALRNGLNVLAVEVHNANLNSSDLSLSAELDYSAPQQAGRLFVRGDVDDNGRHDVTDAVRVLLAQVGRADLPCPEAADIDDNGRVNVADIVTLLDYVFRQGDPPSPPVLEPALDLDDDQLDCPN